MNARFRLGIGELTGLDPIAIIVLAGFDGGVVTVVTLIIPPHILVHRGDDHSDTSRVVAAAPATAAEAPRQPKGSVSKMACYLGFRGSAQ